MVTPKPRWLPVSICWLLLENELDQISMNGRSSLTYVFILPSTYRTTSVSQELWKCFPNTESLNLHNKSRGAGSSILPGNLRPREVTQLAKERVGIQIQKNPVCLQHLCSLPWPHKALTQMPAGPGMDPWGESGLIAMRTFHLLSGQSQACGPYACCINVYLWQTTRAAAGGRSPATLQSMFSDGRLQHRVPSTEQALLSAFFLMNET